MTAGRAPVVVVVGDVMDDIVVRPRGPAAHATDTAATITRSAGGQGANQAVWLADAGASVRFVGRTGHADVERHAAVLRGAGVEPRLAADPAAPTGTIVILVDEVGERNMYTDRGANRNLHDGDLPVGLLDAADLLLVSGYALFEAQPRAAVQQLMSTARDANITVAVDPASTGFLDEVGGAAFLDWVDGADILLPNRAEAEFLAGHAPLDFAIEVLCERFPVVAVTCGADGARVAVRDGQRVHVQAVPATVVDTTGAGDAFSAAFIVSWLQTRDPHLAGTAGVSAAGRAVALAGARP